MLFGIPTFLISAVYDDDRVHKMLCDWIQHPRLETRCSILRSRVT